MAILFEIQKSKDRIRYGNTLTEKALKQHFGVKGSYSLTHSSFDHTPFIFYGKTVEGNTKTDVSETGEITIKTILNGKHRYDNGILPEETELSDTIFVIEKKNANSFVFKGIADLEKAVIYRRKRNGRNSWHLYCEFHGKIRPEENAYEYKTIDKDTLETIVYEPTTEGTKKAVYTTKYERKKANRDAAIAAHGTVCMACGFDFEKAYGKYGKGFIEVHHTKPLYENETEVTPDPETDLICLCSNCHKMIHHFRNTVLTLDELKQIIEEAEQQSE